MTSENSKNNYLVNTAVDASIITENVLPNATVEANLHTTIGIIDVIAELNKVGGRQA